VRSLKVIGRRCWWALFAVAGCGLLLAKPDPTRFYVLAAVADATTPPSGLTVGLGPIVLPPYLQRPEMATRVGANEVRFREFDRWAGSLPTQVGTVLGEDLRRVLGADRVVLFPWYSGTTLDLVVELQVFRFEPDQDGLVHLLGHWRLRDAAHAKDLGSADVDLSEKMASVDPDGEVAALSRALAQLARQIAGAVPAGR
jgi:hypothetical protein